MSQLLTEADALAFAEAVGTYLLLRTLYSDERRTLSSLVTQHLLDVGDMPPRAPLEDRLRRVLAIVAEQVGMVPPPDGTALERAVWERLTTLPPVELYKGLTRSIVAVTRAART